MTALLEVLGLRYQPGGHRILDVPAFAVAEGEVLAIIGPNGAGKSSLMQAVGLLQPAEFGEYRWEGRSVKLPAESLALRRQMAMVMQDSLLLSETVYHNVALGLSLRGIAGAGLKTQVLDMLDRLGIAHLARRPARRLSGGEAQRVSLARALVLKPRLLFLDEPFAALDVLARSQMLRDLRGLLTADRITALFVTHDFSEIPVVADRVAVMFGGEIRQVGTPFAVFNRPADPAVRELVQVAHDLVRTLQPESANR